MKQSTRESPDSSGAPTKLEWLQVGRFLAAFWVVIYHGETQLFRGSFGQGEVWHSYGSLGVDFFFCLSGFIILFRSFDHFGRAEACGRFLQRRAIRIYPIIWFVMLGQVIMSAAIGGATVGSGLQLFTDALLLPADREHTLNVAWTLRHEVFFYGIVGVLMAFKLRVFVGFCMIWALGVILANTGGQAAAPPNLIEGFLFSHWNILFLSGVIVAAVYRNFPKRPRAWLMGGAALVALGVVALWLTGHQPGHAGKTLSQTFASALAFTGALVFFLGCDFSRLRAPRSLVVLGDASYALYLIHSPVLYHIGQRFGGVTGTVLTLAAIPALLVISVLLFRWIEKPACGFLRRHLVSDGGGQKGTPKPEGDSVARASSAPA